MNMMMKMATGAARVAGQGTPGGVRLPAGRGGKAVWLAGVTTGAARIARQGTPGGVRPQAGRSGKAVWPVGLSDGAARVARQGTPGGVRLPAGRGGKAVWHELCDYDVLPTGLGAVFPLVVLQALEGRTTLNPNP